MSDDRNNENMQYADYIMELQQLQEQETPHCGPFPLEYKYLEDQFRSATRVPTHVKRTKNFDFFDALTTKYDVLVKVFEYLHCKDLRNILELNESLANSVAVVLRKRLSPVLFSLKECCYVWPKPFDINPSLCILFNCVYNNFSNSNVISPLKLQTPICLHGDNETRKPVIELLEDELLATKCPISYLACRQVLSSFTQNPTLHGIAIPQIPHVKISVFRIMEKAKSNVSLILQDHIGKDNNLKCLLIFAMSMQRKMIKSVVDTIQTLQPNVSFALGGGFVRGMQTFNQIFKSPKVCRRSDLLCVSFSTSKSDEAPFNAYSIVIREEATSSTLIENYLEKLKQHYTPRKFGVAFRITCVSRQEEVNKEMEALKKLFPDIEVLGFSGDGEIGRDSYNFTEPEHTDVPVPKKRKIGPDKVLHELTTIVVLLTWGKIKPK